MNGRSKTRLGAVVLAVGAAAGVAGAAQSCATDQPSVVAQQITSRAQLIGGPGALGEVGDYLLANEQIRVIIQGEGFSRGFGLYGGSLIDADLQRPEQNSDGSGGLGHDNFSELFPALFLKAMKPTPGGIKTVANPDGSASVIVRGSAADFVFLAQRINDVLLDSSDLLFENEYKLHPGKRYVEITTTVVNGGERTVEFPADAVNSLIGDAELEFPVGDVILFGAGNDVFAEGAGFDVRFTLERLYKTPVALPKLPGLVTPFLATRGDGVSYGFMSGITDPELSIVRRTGFSEAEAATDDLLIPFLASAFTGAFYGAAPKRLEARASFAFKKYFIVGRGDVASIRDVVQEIREAQVTPVAGLVKERLTQAPEPDASVVIFDAEGRAFNQHSADASGQFRGNYPPGEYSYRVVAPGRYTTRPVTFKVEQGKPTFLEIELDSPGILSARVTQASDGREIPAKCSVVGTYPAANAGLVAHEFLYDLTVGEGMRVVDLIPDTVDPMTRRWVEHIMLVNGQEKDRVRPGKYRVYCSRGMEYDVFEQDVEVKAGALTQVDAVLNRVVDTSGWASGDYHLHAQPSVDSSMALRDRVLAVATEGVDIACSSDHNFVTDYGPFISDQDLQTWLQGMVGLEMTTLEVGHFNGFPLRYDPGPITKGAFEWSGRPPQDLFNDLRALGSRGPENTIVQVNHPRDTILGYFNDYNYNPDTGEVEESDSILLSPEGPEFGPDKVSWNFDALEIYNGKRFELLFNYRVPEVLPPPPLPAEIPPAGTVLRDENGKVAFPGAVDDWFGLLNQGRVYTAMANSDTHGMDDEPGIPRTYTPVTDDRPGAVDELEVVRALQNQQAFLTNGPFARINVTGNGACIQRKTGEALGRNECGIGELVTATDGKINVKVQIQAAPWVKLERATFIVNGERVVTVEGDNETLGLVTQDLTFPRDGWFTVEISGDQGMFPMALPKEIPSIQVSDALGSIGSAFGFDFAPFGNLQPTQVTQVYPFAFSNPVFVDVDGNGVYDPPGLSPQALTAARAAPRVRGARLDLRGMPALTKIFGLFGHGH
jgi:hypothetical protein